ncbi:MAG TPA: aminoacyl-histidine dipeptidase [Bacteroidales bacterium]|nr:aminoacyl-histidine dipeptidase [Bacteroidales bacterium]
MKSFEGLEPEGIWSYFDEICKIPRRSSREEKIIEYLVNFGKKHHLETITDEAGNVMIRRPAARGYENRKGICLQSHVDMVAEKNSSSNHDFDTDPIQPVTDGRWIKAKETTLGADNGIGVASQLAILADSKMKHGPIECLFTTEEEVGLKGASKLQSGFIRSKILINLDSEDEGELFIGCAGGIDTTAILTYKARNVPANSVAFRIGVSGLKGGHSGDDINKNRGNSIKILNRFLWSVSKRMSIRIASLDGGNLRNAIPREAYAVITMSRTKSQMLKDEFHQFCMAIKSELSVSEPDLKLEMKPADLPQLVFRKKYQRRMFNLLYGCPHGVISMSRSIKDLVETSTNLASIKFSGQNTYIVSTSQRSSVESEKHNIANIVRSIFELARADVEHSGGYPGWEPNTDSEILKITSDSYKKLFGNEPLVKAIHAGLECGLFLQKFPDLDMISFGPTIYGAHSPDERVEISSVKKYWDLLLEVIAHIPEQKKRPV